MNTLDFGSVALAPDHADTPLQCPNPVPTHDSEARWSLATRVAFRFIFAYLVLFTFPVLDFIVPWVGSRFFHRSIQNVANGSGDTTFDYIEIFCALVAAVLVTLLWSVLDRKRTNYVRLHQWLRVGLRLALGATMLGYGAAKVIPSQMPAPGLANLLETFGDASPMRLLWTFIGASRAYEIFSGAAEMLGAILLFIPGVTTLGALILIGVLTNVVMLNLCYDVPVKINSFHFLLMAIFLAAPDFRNLADLFLFQRPGKLSDIRPVFRRRWLNRGMTIVPLILGFSVAALWFVVSHEYAKKLAVRSPYYGVWTVEEYVVDSNQQPPMLSESTRWRRVIMDYPERLTVQLVDAPQQKFLLQLDQSKKLFTLTKLGDANWKSDLSFHDPGNDVLILDGQLDGHRVHAKLRREEERKFFLTSRGFHWINEYPLNR